VKKLYVVLSLVLIALVAHAALPLRLISGVILEDQTASRAIYVDSSKQVQSSATTGTELGYVSGVTSAIQTQIDAIGSPAFETISSIDTTDANNEIISLSGASFTLTLHTAVGNTGQVLELLHQGTTITQVYTLATTSSQTIGGIAGGSYALHTKGERLKLISDGSNWLILGHHTSTAWVSVGPLVIDAITTAPVKGTTTTDDMMWRRDGQDMLVSMTYIQSAAGSNTTGTGDYLFAIPYAANLTIDTTLVTVYATAEGSGDYQMGTNVGSFAGWNAAGSDKNMNGFVCPYDNTRVRVFTQYGTSNVNRFNAALGSTVGDLNDTTVTYVMEYRIPITGWQP